MMKEILNYLKQVEVFSPLAFQLLLNNFLLVAVHVLKLNLGIVVFLEKKSLTYESNYRVLLPTYLNMVFHDLSDLLDTFQRLYKQRDNSTEFSDPRM